MGHLEPAEPAAVTDAVNLSHNPLALEVRIRTLLDKAYELVSGDALEIHVTPSDLDIRLADAGSEDAHQRLPFRGARHGDFCHLHFAVEHNRPHFELFLWRKLAR
jgi:hypothetical protein